jgi:hypothetical protein
MLTQIRYENYLSVTGEAPAETAGGVPVLKVAEGDRFCN